MVAVNSVQAPRRALVLTLLILLPLIAASVESLGALFLPAARASVCTLEVATEPDWGEDVAAWNMSGYYDMNRWSDDEERNFLNDEESEGVNSNRKLDGLTTGFHTSVIIENDTASGIRLNLTVGYRYTFCVTLHTTGNNSTSTQPVGDVYLLQQLDFQRYEWDYSARHDYDWAQFNAVMPPEWQSSIAWLPFRDVHSYERVSRVDFAVALDHEEITTSLFEDPQQRWMYLVLDAWDNGRDADTPAPRQEIAADVTVMVEERTLIPNWTVSLFCCVLMIGLLAIPIVLHVRFSNSGNSVKIEGPNVDLMPMLDTPAQKPAIPIDPTQPPPPPPPPPG